MSELFSSWIPEIRGRLESPPPARLSPGDQRQAAVLVPLYVDAGQLWTVLTKRSEELPHHKSQIAFPGGGAEIGEDPWATALRETHEELGVEAKAILRLGQLDEAETPSGFHIVPCVGAVPHPLKTKLNADEIAEVFSVPLSAFSDVQMVEEQDVVIDGTRRRIRIYHVAHRRIWGLTARVIQNLMQRLGMDLPAVFIE